MGRAPRRRANWGCESITYKPAQGQDQRNFIAWRFGPKYPDFYPGVQFPTDNKEAWNQATRARYDEFDTVDNVELQAEAAAQAIDKIGPVALVTNSAGGLRALMAAAKAKSGNVKAIVAYENPGFVFPKGEGPQLPPGPFGPIYVSQEEFRKLPKFPHAVRLGRPHRGKRNLEAAAGAEQGLRRPGQQVRRPRRDPQPAVRWPCTATPTWPSPT